MSKETLPVVCVHRTALRKRNAAPDARRDFMMSLVPAINKK